MSGTGAGKSKRSPEHRLYLDELMAQQVLLRKSGPMGRKKEKDD